MKHRVLVATSLVFLSASALLWHTAPYDGHFDLDSYTYDRIAHHFVQHQQLIDPDCADGVPIQPTGYPFIVGVLYSLSPSLFSVVVLQVSCALACAGMMFVLATLLLSNAYIGTIAFVLTTCNLGFLVYSQLVLAEIITVFLLIQALLLLVLFLKTNSVPLLGMSGIYFGVSIWFKPVALLYCPFLVLLILWHYHLTLRGFGLAFLFTVLFYTIPFGLVMKNYYYFNYCALAPMNELNVYQVFLSKVIAHVEQRSVYDVLEHDLAFTGTHVLDSAGWHNARTLFWHHLKNHPFVMVKIWMLNVGKTVAGLYTTQLKLLYHPEVRGGQCSFFNHEGSLLERISLYITHGTSYTWLHVIGWLEALLNGIRWLYVVLGIAYLYQRKQYQSLYLVLSWLVYFTGITGFDGCCRYRIVLEPMLIVGAACGIWYAYIYLTLKKEDTYVQKI